MAAAPELAPFATRIVLRRALWPFTALVAYLFLWGILQALDGFVRACFGTAETAVSWIPLVGRVVSQSLHATEHKIGSILGKYASYFETQAGIRWHSLGQLVTQLAADVEAAALLDWTLAKRISHFLTQAQVHLLLKGLHAIGKVVTQQTTIVEHKVVRVEKIVGTKANAAVVHRVGALAGELEHVIEWDIPHLRARSRVIEKSLDRLWHRIRAGEKLVVTTAFAGAVSVALARIGLGWLHCTSFKNFGKRLGCTGWHLLDELLAGVIDVLVIADLCQLTKLMIDVAESAEVQGVISGIITGMDELLLCQKVKRPPALSGYWTEPPPAQPFAALPAV